MIEIWKDIKNYEGIYQVSNLGNVKSLNYCRGKRENNLKQYKNKDGYCIVILYKNKKSRIKLVHRIVLETFCLNLNNKPQVNHINGIKFDNKLENLEWCTRSENMIHAYKTGLEKTNDRMINARKQNIKIATSYKKKKVIQKDMLGKIIREFESVNEAIRQTKINHISDCALGKCESAGGYTWQYKTI